MRFGLLTDDRFVKHAPPTDHVERPGRLQAITDAMRDTDLASDFLSIEPRLATDAELLLCHRPQVLEAVREITAAGGGNLDPDTYMNEWSEKVARLSIGGGIELCKAVLSGELDRGFSLCRPPGHHATPTRSMGFCLFSTVAVVAKNLRNLAPRILIFDWDVHHGNGTQDCLYDWGGTCFVSMHQSPFYPGTGYSDERGEGDGQGSIYNIPLPAGCGDGEYLKAYHTIVRPIIQRYDPHLLIVSAGYDSHKNDLLGGMKVSKDGFAQLSSLVAEDADRTSCDGRLVGFLEGGYHLGGLAESVLATLGVWSGQTKSPNLTTGPVKDQVNRLINRLATDFGL